MCKPVHISPSENKAPAQLKRILPQLVLMMSLGASLFPRHSIVLSQ